jgi:transmembrane sensor
MNNKDCWILLENEGFVRWVLHPDAASDRYWEGWIRQDTRRAALVEQAKELLHQLQQSPPPPERQALSRQIWKGIHEELQAEKTVAARRIRPRVWMAAATLVILVSAGAALWKKGPAPAKLPMEAVAVNPVPGNSLIECRNLSGTPQKIYLVDGSVVTLEPQSALSYNRFLGKKTREVTLKGNAFFDIAPDANRPFLVRSGDLVTQVLGTSFRVVADPGQDIQVAVRTGKVSIYKATDFDNGHQAFCVLLPHQEAVFHKKDQNLAFQPNAEAQLLIPPPVETVSMNFDDAPVITILDQLGKMYHINMQYNRDSLQQCRLTTSLQEEKLTDKLDIICRAINATYRTQDDTIIIEGGHCP